MHLIESDGESVLRGLQDELHKVPVYANVKQVCRPDGPMEAIEINYLTFYAHNGTYDVGYMGLFRVGSHDGDWEHCTVRCGPVKQEDCSSQLTGFAFPAEWALQH